MLQKHQQLLKQKEFLVFSLHFDHILEKDEQKYSHNNNYCEQTDPKKEINLNFLKQVNEIHFI
jgi:hypothetical protein